MAQLRAILVRRNDLWSRDPDTESERAELVSADVALHRAIVAASHNEVYLQFYDLLVPTLCRSMEIRTVGSEASYEAQHTELVDAIIAGDPKRAEAAARVFISVLRG